jgi:phosphoribosyl-AMP cyclohydrolase
MLKFDSQGLVPVVIQDDATNEVLMVASMNAEAFHLTRQTGYTHLYSRSRNRLWRKGEESGNVQEVRGLFVNCEENSVLLRVVQHGGAACHTGYKSCYYRRMMPDDSYQVIAQRVFDPAVVYHKEPLAPAQRKVPPFMSEQPVEILSQLETALRQLYGAYLYLRDHNLSTESNTSRLLQERSHSYLASRLADELQELADVQSGEHVHSGREADTVLEGSQVGYWLFLLAATNSIRFDEIAPHVAILTGFTSEYSEDKVIELRQESLNLIGTGEHDKVVRGLQLGFTFIGWACAAAGVSPLAPAEADLRQMRRRGWVS